MQIGKLKDRVTIQTQSSSQDAYGQQVETWTEVATVWAEVIAVSGREYFAAQANRNPVQTKINLRYRTGITPAMRAVHGSTIYNIEAVLPQGKEALVLMCSTGIVP